MHGDLAGHESIEELYLHLCGVICHSQSHPATYRFEGGAPAVEIGMKYMPEGFSRIRVQYDAFSRETPITPVVIHAPQLPSVVVQERLRASLQ
jgi:hypothetical protein